MNSRWSPFDSDNVRLDLAVHVDFAEPSGDRFRSYIG